MNLTLPSVPLNVRPSVRSYNSWDSLRFSQRAIPTIETQLDTFQSGPSLEAARRPSVVRVDEPSQVTPVHPLYTFGWRSYLQIWAAAATTTTLIIAANNLYARLHGKG